MTRSLVKYMLGIQDSSTQQSAQIMLNVTPGQGKDQAGI